LMAWDRLLTVQAKFRTPAVEGGTGSRRVATS
jgi:hypothetical protein